MMQKMRRYVKAFSKEDEKPAGKEGLEKSDVTLRSNGKNSISRKAQAGWEVIRQSALGLEMEQELPEEDQNIKFV